MFIEKASPHKKGPLGHSANISHWPLTGFFFFLRNVAVWMMSHLKKLLFSFSQFSFSFYFFFSRKWIPNSIMKIGLRITSSSFVFFFNEVVFGSQVQVSRSWLKIRKEILQHPLLVFCFSFSFFLVFAAQAWKNVKPRFYKIAPVRDITKKIKIATCLLTHIIIRPE